LSSVFQSIFALIFSLFFLFFREQIFITFSILFTYALGYGLINRVPYDYQIMLGIGSVPSWILLAISLILLPESDVWKAAPVRSHNKKKKQMNLLCFYYCFEQEEEQRMLTRQDVPGSWVALFTKTKKSLFLGVLLAITLQLTGINAIIYYAPLILKKNFPHAGLLPAVTKDFFLFLFFFAIEFCFLFLIPFFFFFLFILSEDGNYGVELYHHVCVYLLGELVRTKNALFVQSFVDVCSECCAGIQLPVPQWQYSRQREYGLFRCVHFGLRNGSWFSLLDFHQ
jgi:hypothetical protein